MKFDAATQACHDKRPHLTVKIPGGVWLTKYALTKGIEYAEHAYDCFDVRRVDGDWTHEKEGYVSVRFDRGTAFGEGSMLFHNKDYHFSLEAAQARVAAMVAAKRKSVEKMLAKLDATANKVTTFASVPDKEG